MAVRRPNCKAMPKRLIIALLFAALVPALAAQRGSFGGGGFHGGSHNGIGFVGNRSRFGRYPAFWGDPLYADFPVQSLAYEAPAPPVIVVQPAAAAEPQQEPESVVIEWQGDRYVRSTGEHHSSAASDYSEASANRSTSASQAAAQAPPDLVPAVLVYRDGHREQVLDYVIESGTLYARGDYYRDGYWTKNIRLASLDIPATLKANEQTGVRFVLPSSPNEVVTRP